MAHQSESLEIRYKKLNLEMISLSQSFERYFSGKDNVPPVLKLQQYKMKVRNFTQEKFKDNALKFKVGNLYQKLLAYESNWNQKLYRKEVGLSSNGKIASSKPNKQYLIKSEEDQLYRDFINSQKYLSGKTVDKDKFIERIYAQKKKLEEQNKVDDIWFKIIVKDGKTTIKAYRKKD